MSGKAVVRVLVGALALTLLLAACGDDDDDGGSASGTEATEAGTDAGTAGGEADDEAYCAASAEVVEIFAGVGPEGPTNEQFTAALALIPEGQAAAPELADELGQLASSLEAAAAGDFSVFESEETQAAEAAVHAYDIEHCDIATHDVTTIDYGYEGVPETVEAGWVSFDLTNAGTEQHELVILKKGPGVTESFADILALPQEQALTMVEVKGAGFVAPGQPDQFAEGILDAGDYLAVCFIPQGSVGETEGTGPPHFTLGMLREFTVA